jgi:putative endopeptidase
MKKLFLAITGGAMLLTACNNHPKVENATSYFDTKGMDSTVSPADNFYDYANGKWVKTAQIPADQSSWGSFDSLRQGNINKLRTILDDLAAKTDLKKGSLEQKAGDFYASGMDTVAIEKVGYAPLKARLAQIDAVQNYKDLITLLAKGTQDGDGDLLALYVNSDARNSSMNILNLFQAGTSLPEKGYYTRTDSVTANVRKQLVLHAAKYFVLTGEDSVKAAKDAQDILKIETELAQSHLAPAELRDPVSNYHKMSVADLQKLAPNIPWKETLSEMGYGTDSLNVAQPKYVAALSSLLASEPISVWKNKVKFDYIAGNADALSKAFRDEDFHYGQLFSGAKTQRERWKIMVQETDGDLKDVLGQLYVQKYFTADAKRRMDSLVNNLQNAFRVRIGKLTWMTDSTKQLALVKLNSIMKKIGYPDKWKSYDDVDINRNDYFANQKSVTHHFFAEQMKKLNKPVDRSEWGMTPPTVNAYYEPANNEIVFPAGILQFPFFDANADDAINYGAIGVVIGHEMTHGFDDEGRQFDEKGNLKGWWTKADGEAFLGKAKGLVDEYNGFVVLDSLHVNGQLTLGENIADLGGVTIAYDAFQLTKEAHDTTKIDGFTPNQRFFLGFAQVWRGSVRPERMRTLIATNPHSPYRFRVNGVLTNFEPFYQAFGVTEKDKMYKAPADRVVIW